MELDWLQVSELGVELERFMVFRNALTAGPVEGLLRATGNRNHSSGQMEADIVIKVARRVSASQRHMAQAVPHSHV